MNRIRTSGAVLATVVGLMFAAQPVLAQDSGSQSSQANVKCVGGNSCKGQSACQTAQNGCKGQNSCKGKGWITTASTQECTQKGGHVESN
jgi:hypothetical protein